MRITSYRGVEEGVVWGLQVLAATGPPQESRAAGAGTGLWVDRRGWESRFQGRVVRTM